MSRPQPILTVDTVLLTLEGGVLKVALHERAAEPFKGARALPGGFVHPEEDTSTLDTAYRVLRQKTGFTPRHLEQLSVFSGPGRDPRGWSVSMAFVALSPINALRGSTSPVFSYAPVDALPPLPFDHQEIIAQAVQRLRNKAAYSSLPCALLPELFTLRELQEVYEQVLGQALDKSSFRRKIDELGFVAPSEAFTVGTHRPARLYSFRGYTAFDRSLTTRK
ncbi:MAG: NUDIX hydrolase [Zoogloea sp.]|nr:NUDIX hydrolase [Zoogloea sp.]